MCLFVDVFSMGFGAFERGSGWQQLHVSQLLACKAVPSSLHRIQDCTGLAVWQWKLLLCDV
jgi:hypothetical protein